MVIVVLTAVKLLSFSKPAAPHVINIGRAKNQCRACPVCKAIDVGVVLDSGSPQKFIFLGDSRFLFVLHNVSFPPEARYGRTQKEPVAEDDHRL